MSYRQEIVGATVYWRTLYIDSWYSRLDVTSRIIYVVFFTLYTLESINDSHSHLGMIMMQCRDHSASLIEFAEKNMRTCTEQQRIQLPVQPLARHYVVDRCLAAAKPIDTPSSLCTSSVSEFNDERTRLGVIVTARRISKRISWPFFSLCTAHHSDRYLLCKSPH